MGESTAALVVEDLHKKFGALEVLKGISLSANDGDVIAIVGRSGSGKSTFLRCINLLETPDSGRVYVEQWGPSVHISVAKTDADRRWPTATTAPFEDLTPKKWITNEVIRRQKLGDIPANVTEFARQLHHQMKAAADHRIHVLKPRTIENGFELTGPIARGDWGTVDGHRAAIHEHRAELDELYETLAGATVALAT
jgi:ABC-type branched-subunit amino acid transport system ATPase component